MVLLFESLSLDIVDDEPLSLAELSMFIKKTMAINQPSGETIILMLTVILTNLSHHTYLYKPHSITSLHCLKSQKR